MSASQSTSGYPTLAYPPPPPTQYGFSFREANLGIRAFAAFVVLVVLGLIATAVALHLGALTAFAVLAGGGVNPWFTLLWGPIALTTFALFVRYFTVLESGSGQTLGKRLLDLRVVSIFTGPPPDLAHSLLRNILRIVDWHPFLYLIGIFVAALSSRRQRLGDHLADTVVIRS